MVIFHNDVKLPEGNLTENWGTDCPFRLTKFETADGLLISSRNTIGFLLALLNLDPYPNETGSW